MESFFDPAVQAPLKMVLTPLFFGLTTGPIYGGITGAMMNMGGTAEMKSRVLRHTAIFSAMGLAYGIAGVAVSKIRASSYADQDVKDVDDYKGRMIAGCAAGLTLGAANKSLGTACGACLSLGMVSAALKFLDDHHDLVKTNDKIKQALKPVLISDIPGTISVNGPSNNNFK